MNYLKDDNYGSDMDLRSKILDEIRNDLSQMKPDIIASIVDEVVHKMDVHYASQIERLENRISELERCIGDTQEVPRRKKAPFKLPGTSRKIKVTSKMSDFGFHFNGWIYYLNEDMGNFLYRIREDGSENTQLTDYSVKHIDRVNGGYLYFWDGSLRTRKIKLS